MRIGGIIDISTKDIPNRSSIVIFTVGCNFQCEFCHNKYLLNPNVGREYEIKEILDKITTNLLVSGVSITGGEPTLQTDLLELCTQIREHTDKYLSIDTNGSNPEAIRKIIPFINRIALDLKGPPDLDKLEKITKVNINLDKILETIRFLIAYKEIDFEIRTTYTGNLLNSDDIDDIITYLKDVGFNGKFVLQQYQFLEGVGEEYNVIFSKPEHEVLFNILKPYKGVDLPFDIFLRDEIVGYSNIDNLSL